jgi:Fur family zinc uptake transcriptional regulator
MPAPKTERGPADWTKQVRAACAHGFLHKIESRNAFARCEHLGHAHQGVLLLCEKCGRSDEIEDHSVALALQETVDRVGFHARRRMIEMVGLCRDCGAAAA